jgi:hypothetical protein
VVALAMTASRAAPFDQRPIDHQAMTPVWASLINRRPLSAPALGAPGGNTAKVALSAQVIGIRHFGDLLLSAYFACPYIASEGVLS